MSRSLAPSSAVAECFLVLACACDTRWSRSTRKIVCIDDVMRRNTHLLQGQLKPQHLSISLSVRSARLLSASILFWAASMRRSFSVRRQFMRRVLASYSWIYKRTALLVKLHQRRAGHVLRFLSILHHAARACKRLVCHVVRLRLDALNIARHQKRPIEKIELLWRSTFFLPKINNPSYTDTPGRPRFLSSSLMRPANDGQTAQAMEHIMSSSSARCGSRMLAHTWQRLQLNRNRDNFRRPTSNASSTLL